MKRTSLHRAATMLLGALAASAALAQQPRTEPLPEIPPPPRSVQSTDNLEPQVTIRQDGQNRLEEYRVGGKLYAVRVIPPIGKPYLLVDRVGKGVMTRMDDITGGVNPPQWVLFNF